MCSKEQGYYGLDVCNDCGEHTASTVTQDYDYTTATGITKVPNITQIICSNCDAVYLPAGEGQKISNYIKELKGGL